MGVSRSDESQSDESPEDRRRQKRLVDLIQRNAGRFSYNRLGPRTRRITTLVAGIVFVVAGVYSIAAFDFERGIAFGPLIGVLVTAPLPLILSGFEFSITASLLGKPKSRHESQRIAVLGYALNYLPLPGGTLLRISALTGADGSDAGRGAVATIGIGGMWLAVALVGSSVGGLMLGQYAWSAALGAVAIVAGVIAAYVIKGVARTAPLAAIGKAFAIEFAFVVAAIVRTWLGFLALGVSGVTLGASMLVASSSAVSTAIGFVPAGLGIQELLASGLATVGGLEATAGFLVSGLLRLAGTVAAAAIAGVLAIRGDRSNLPSAS